ncbi:MAG: hypothetical protein ACJAS1_007468, partial [Oleiphilaceae bacterium]
SSYRLITTWFSTVIFLQGTYTPLVHAHAGRTQKYLERLILRRLKKTKQHKISAKYWRYVSVSYRNYLGGVSGFKFW